MQCEGARWSLATKRLERCEAIGLWDHQGRRFCYFCLKVDEGLIDSDRRGARSRPAEPPDPLMVLLAEWG